MKKALITGVSGQDGSYLTEFLIEKGYEVAKMFDVKIKVMNVYFTKDKVITNF